MGCTHRAAAHQLAVGSGTTLTVNCSTGIIPVSAGDYFEVYTFSASKTDADGKLSWFHMEIIE